MASSIRAWHLLALTLAVACAHGAEPLTLDDADLTSGGSSGRNGNAGEGGQGGVEVAGSAGNVVGLAGSGGDTGSMDPADAGSGGSDITTDSGIEAAADGSSDAPSDAADAHDASKDGSLDAGPLPKRPTGITMGTTSVATARQTPSAGGVTYNDECQPNQALVGFKGTVEGIVDGGVTPTNLRTVQGVCAPLSVSATAPYTVSVGTTNLLPLRGILPTPATAQTVTCPANQVIVGFVGRQATYIEEMQFRCSPLAINGTTPSFTLALGNITTTGPIGAATAGAAFTAIDCPANQVAVAQSPRAGSAIDSFGLVCRAPSLVFQ